ncbi:DUF397 domain-containing protein [Streptomyces qinzhouensis]|uniref:DUF397 domain-containing protein n=1 Tax=Streptomyces qinzhouensis TaxID=2599401 RepID=A0A5B8JLG1_9ACTN|nr:DUF397 domain-containing protein [Streptomyces qinzhouensis]QDY78373.1 DUF397 domain-containing protein [Streptomyces qinzhouensis]
MTTPLTWFKSSYSGDEPGSSCVEVAYDWFKSSYSTEEGGNCIEVATHSSAVHVRDSKVPDGPTFAVAPATWRAFVAAAPDTLN